MANSKPSSQSNTVPDIHLVKSWAQYKSQVVRLYHVWVIENFSLKPKKVNECLESPVFSDNTTEPTKWQLQIYPNKRGLINRSSYIGLKESQLPIMAKCELSLLNSSNKVLAEIGPLFEELCAGKRIGEDSLMPIDLLGKGIIKDDNLHVQCKIAFEVKETTTTGFSVVGKKHSFSHFTGSLADNFGKLLNSMTSTDVVIEVRGHSFEAHKFILTTRSSKFLALLQNLPSEKKASPLKIHDIEPKVFSEVLRFIYTDKINKLDEFAPQLLAAADTYKLDLDTHDSHTTPKR